MCLHTLCIHVRVSVCVCGERENKRKEESKTHAHASTLTQVLLQMKWSFRTSHIYRIATLLDVFADDPPTLAVRPGTVGDPRSLGCCRKPSSPSPPPPPPPPPLPSLPAACQACFPAMEQQEGASSPLTTCTRLFCSALW